MYMNGAPVYKHVHMHAHTTTDIHQDTWTDLHTFYTWCQAFFLTPPPGVRSGTSPWRRYTTKLSGRSLPGPLTWQTRPLCFERPHMWIGVFSSFIHILGERYHIIWSCTCSLIPSIPLIYVYLIYYWQTTYVSILLRYTYNYSVLHCIIKYYSFNKFMPW